MCVCSSCPLEKQPDPHPTRIVQFQCAAGLDLVTSEEWCSCTTSLAKGEGRGGLRSPKSLLTAASQIQKPCTSSTQRATEQTQARIVLLLQAKAAKTAFRCLFLSILLGSRSSSLSPSPPLRAIDGGQLSSGGIYVLHLALIATAGPIYHASRVIDVTSQANIYEV